MKAICVTTDRDLVVRDLATPIAPAAGHLLIDLDGAAINHGDKTFLRMPASAGPAAVAAHHDVWGASGAGRVVAIGAGVPDRYLGRQVAAYRSLRRTEHTLGLWSERAQAPYLSCLILPENVDALDYCGSLVNVITAYAFVEEVLTAGHRGIVVTAGASATGYALAALARRRGIPAIFLARTETSGEALKAAGIEHVIVQTDGYLDRLAALAAQLNATAIFEGVGGELPGTIAPYLPMHSTMYFYGFLARPASFAMPTTLFMMKDLTLRRFSNFESPKVKDSAKLEAALLDLESVIDNPLFRTRIGMAFNYDDIHAAMAYEGTDGRKAILRSSAPTAA